MEKNIILLLACFSAFALTNAAINLVRDDILAQANGGGVWTTGVNSASVSWEPYDNNGTMMQKYTISGPDAGYVAMAISLDVDMGPADDCYYCSRANSTSPNVSITSAYLTGHGRPVIVGLVNADHVVSTSIANGMITCEFLRPISVEKNVSGIVTTWNVSATLYNLLYADGAVAADGLLSRHASNGRTFTNGTFNLLNNANYNQPATTVQTTSSAMVVSSTLTVMVAALIFSMF